MSGYIHRKTPRASIRYSQTELFWAAGFLEGEGHFGFAKAGTQRIQAAQVGREPLDRLKALFGGQIVRLNPGPSTDKAVRQPIDLWYIGGARARGAMLTVFGLMSARKKAQIAAAIRKVRQA